MFHKLKQAFLWCNYKLYEKRNTFTHRAISHSQGKNGETIIAYTILGKRDVYRIAISELLGKKDLVQKFNPLQAVKFGSIALGDVLFSIPQNDRERKYKEIKNILFEKE